MLALLRIFDERFPSQRLVDLTIRYRRDHAASEKEFRHRMKEMHFGVAGVSHRMTDGGRAIELITTLHAGAKADVAGLATALQQDPRIVEYALTPRNE